MIAASVLLGVLLAGAVMVIAWFLARYEERKK